MDLVIANVSEDSDIYAAVNEDSALKQSLLNEIPCIKLFRRGEMYPYHGPDLLSDSNVEKDVIRYFQEAAKPSVTMISSLVDLQEKVLTSDKDHPVILGFFEGDIVHELRDNDNINTKYVQNRAEHPYEGPYTDSQFGYFRHAADAMRGRANFYILTEEALTIVYESLGDALPALPSVYMVNDDGTGLEQSHLIYHR